MKVNTQREGEGRKRLRGRERLREGRKRVRGREVECMKRQGKARGRM